MGLGATTRIARQKAFFNQEEFAEKLHVALSTINRWELNKVWPNVKAMKAIKQFCAENGIDYEPIVKGWSSYGKEKNS